MVLFLLYRYLKLFTDVIQRSTNKLQLLRKEFDLMPSKNMILCIIP